ncbi:hypothetical protein [Derxia lacustris]|uniref:hypothetical protein n=1 Tax=Derxia lacustris TaxID=764842 RepID=UPI000A173231|nr:hypothetical protein [Derxia lacustris]
MRRSATAARLGAAALTAALQAGPACAARPMITDDARVVDPHSCQVESWVRRNEDSSEFWALPACNLGGFELALGGARGRDAEGTRTTDVVLQAKTLLKPLDVNGWGLGLAVGNVNHPSLDSSRAMIGDLYVNLPASFSFRDDAFVLHLNAGLLREKATAQARATWGLGSETQLSERFWLIAESFGQGGSPAFAQLGLRWWLLPNRLQVDLTGGAHIGGRLDQRWMSLGLRVLSDAFLP